MFSFLKKIWIICFTNNPYLIKAFNKIYLNKPGSPMDVPESVTGILKFENGEIINYPQPLTINEQPLNDRFIGNSPRFQYNVIVKTPDRWIYSIANGCIIGQTGLVYDETKRCFIDESAKDWVINLKHSPYLNAVNLQKLTCLKGVTLSFLTIGAEGGFYHFLFESIVKANLYGILIDSANYLLFNGLCTEWKLKWIAAAGIKESKIIWADSMTHLKCEQLIFTNRLVGDQQINKWCIGSLKGLFNIKENELKLTSKSILWISRQGLEAREIEWENEVSEILPNIEFLDLVQLSTAETIYKLQLATHIIAPHGAGLSNIYLCNPGTKVLELFPTDAYFQPCYQRLSAVCQLAYEIAFLDFKRQNFINNIDSIKDMLLKFTC
jgi:capsular polysaccharide biosynthesis protein